jgi:hypothetical protein
MSPAAPPARHRLHPLELIAMAWRTFKREPGRVVIPGLVIFGLDAFQGTLYTVLAVDHLGLESLASTFVFGASTLGLTFYSGMLERLIGSVERNEPAQPIGHVIRTLPWGRLLVAEAILLVVDAAAALLVVLPGLIVGTLFALVGPLINLLDSSVPDAFRRSVQLVGPHFMLVFVFISIPLAIEHEVLVLIADLIPHEHVWLIFLSNFVLGDLFGMALGLMEVTLAERLVMGARGPGHGVRSEDIELVEPDTSETGRGTTGAAGAPT